MLIILYIYIYIYLTYIKEPTKVPVWTWSPHVSILTNTGKNHSISQMQRTRNGPWAKTHTQGKNPPSSRLSLLWAGLSDLSNQKCVPQAEWDKAGTQKQQWCQAEGVTGPQRDKQSARGIHRWAIHSTLGIKEAFHEEDCFLSLPKSASNRVEGILHVSQARVAC